MIRLKLYKFALILSLVATIMGAVFKIQHWPGSSPLLLIGVFTSLIYIVIGLSEIYKTESKSVIEKLFWLIGFIVFSPLTGLIYYYSALKPNKQGIKNGSA